MRLLRGLCRLSPQQRFEVGIVPTHDLPLLDGSTASQPISSLPSLIGWRYVVGGHVPIEVVNRLSRENRTSPHHACRHAAGSPGMGGEKDGPIQDLRDREGLTPAYATV